MKEINLKVGPPEPLNKPSASGADHKRPGSGSDSGPHRVAFGLIMTAGSVLTDTADRSSMGSDLSSMGSDGSLTGSDGSRPGSGRSLKEIC